MSGQTRFNILMLGVVHDGIAYPLLWKMLGKKGNSNSEERMDLLDRFEKIFPNIQVAYISGDRLLCRQGVVNLPLNRADYFVSIENTP